jgi:hypothetical protein
LGPHPAGHGISPRRRLPRARERKPVVAGLRPEHVHAEAAAVEASAHEPGRGSGFGVGYKP